jgi:predicted ATP-grasp superfamily ATP-dependent carboligase
MNDVADQNRSLIVIGASARAAAFSALRAGLRPWCADLFADRDLLARCPARRLAGRYPHGFEQVLADAPPGPWMYTGALENWPHLIRAWERRRPLWGASGGSLEIVRDPMRVSEMLRDAGLPTPHTRKQPPDDLSHRWLVKPRRGAGGVGIQEWRGAQKTPSGERLYWQEYVAGEPAAAIYAAIDGDVHFLGLTRQLVGELWLNAAPFHYCGSVGPLRPTAELRRELDRIGDVLARGGGLAGLFGIDGILAGGHFWPVEVNPRYTASVEVLEYATGTCALGWHRRAFDPGAPMPPRSPEPSAWWGKAVLFAPADLIFPGDFGRLPGAADPHEFADIPQPGDKIGKGRPVLTFFARGQSASACEDGLRLRAGELSRRFWPVPTSA